MNRWEKGQLLVKCPSCDKEDGEGIRVVWDKNAKKNEDHE